MKVTRSMLHSDLQPFYWRLRHVGVIVRFRWLALLIDRQIEVCVWDTKTNRLAWSAYLANLHSRGDVIPAYAAPARCIDFSGLPPTITFVGSLEPFYWETKSYVAALREAGVEVAFEEFENCFHGFDTIAVGANISNAALDYTFARFADFYDRYTVS